MINGLPLPAMFLAPDMRCIKANRLAKNMFPHYRKGRPLSAVIDHPNVLDIVSLAVEDGGVHDCEITQGDRNKRIFRVQVNGKVRRNKKHRLLLVFYDITAQRELEDVRAAFVANVSHELRSPLTTLLGAVQAVESMEDRNSETAGRFLQIMQGEAERMRELVNDLLVLSATESREHITPEMPVAIGALIAQAVDGLKIQADKRKITITANIAADMPEIPADEGEIIQVLLNLADNAIKYSRKNTEVTINAEQLVSSNAWPEGALKVSVHNWGDLIEPNKIPRLTERFYRLDDSRSREMGGTGLGLAIVKHIMNRHRGALVIESIIEDGTTFTIFLPLFHKEGA